MPDANDLDLRGVIILAIWDCLKMGWRSDCILHLRYLDLDRHDRNCTCS